MSNYTASNALKTPGLQLFSALAAVAPGGCRGPEGGRFPIESTRKPDDTFSL
jgi:hypothetical protein